MGSLATATPGTLAEHDIILSISEEAINRQFTFLYNKPLNPGADPDPPSLDQDQQIKPAKSNYLINHDLTIYSYFVDENDKIQFNTECGLFAHVKCPTISLKGLDPNVARITYTFEESKDATTPDSQFKREVRVGNGFKSQTTVVNGWSMSWLVKLGNYPFQNVQQELLNRAENQKDPVQLYSETLQKLKAVDSSQFTITAIFCMFDSVAFSNSFQIQDANGVTPKFADDFNRSVGEYFKRLQKNVNPGTSIPDHPFVLGYSLSQSLRDVKDILPKASVGPPYFIPKAVLATITPGKSNLTNGTLNFCMLTGRESTSEPARNPEKFDILRNSDSGKLPETFFDLTKTKEHDGIMGFARDLIWDRFISELMRDTFLVNFSKVYKTTGLVEIHASTTDRTLSPDKPPTCTYEQHTTANSVFEEDKSKSFVNEQLLAQQAGTASIKASWTSDLQTNANVGEKTRPGELLLQSKLMLKTYLDCKGCGCKRRGSVHEKPRLVEGPKISVLTIEIACKYAVVITASKAGTISITMDSSKSIPPPLGDDGKIKYSTGTRPVDQFGAFMVYSGPKNMDDLWKWSKHLALQDTLTTNLKASLDTMAGVKFDDLKSKIIMPAGNVFNFAGIDVDLQGNMYTHVSFSQGAENVTKTIDGKASEITGEKAAT